MGIRLSAPSRLKRLWPVYLLCRKRSNASASLSLCRIWSWSSLGSSWGTPSTCSWIHCFSSVWELCMYSTVPVRQ